MRIILDSFKVMSILLIRNPLFWLLSVSFIIYNFLGLRTFSSGVDFSPGEGLVRMSFAVQAGILVFLFLGVLFVRTEDNVKLDELLYTIPNAARNKLIGKLLLFISLNLLLTLIVWVIHYSLFSIRGISFSSFHIHALNYMILFWSLTFFISLLIGILLSSWIKNKLVYPMILIIWIIIGPVNTYFSGDASPNSMLSNFLVWMNLGEPNPTALFNDLYGFETSNYHWNKKTLFISFILLLLYCTFWFKKAFKKGKRRFLITITILSILIVGLGFNLGLERQPYISTPYSSSSRDDTEYNYYSEVNKPESEENLNSQLKINQYSINLDVDRNVKVDTTFNIENLSTSLTDTLKFTLYHGFKVKEVVINKQSVSFKQKDDSLTLALKEPLHPKGKLNIQMTYEGLSSPLFFANERAIYLPYYFPWLPSLNTEPAFTITRKYGLVRQNHQWNQPADIRLRFSGPHKIYTNLSPVNDRQWVGTVSNGVSIVAGELNDIQTANHTLIEPTSWIVNKHEIPRFEETLDNLFSYVSDTYEVDTLTVPNQIFYIPTLSISDFSNEDLVWYAEDHLIYGSYLMHNETFFQNESFIAYDIFPSITWKMFQKDVITDRGNLKLFSDVTAYLYNQTHEIEDDGELLDRSQPSDEIQRVTKGKILDWIMSEEKPNRKIQFTQGWFQLIQNDSSDWAALNQLVDSYMTE